MPQAAKILILDDEPHILRALGFVLEKEGYQLLSAMDSEEAVALAREHRPDLAILDVMLPRSDGFLVCRKLKEDPALASMAIVFLTAKGQESDHRRALAAGGDCYLTKPFSPSEVVTVVRTLLGSRS